MSDDRKTKRIVLLLLLALLTIGAIAMFVSFKYSKAKVDIVNLQLLLDSTNHTIERTYDDLNREVARAKSIEIDRHHLELLTMSKDSLIASLSTLLTKERSKVLSLTSIVREFNVSQTAKVDSVKTQFVVVNETDTLYIDSTFYATYSDPYIDQSIIANSSGVDFSLTIRDTVSVIEFWDKSSPFSTPQLMIDVISHNPYSSVSQLRSIKVQSKPPKVSLGIGVGYGAVLSDQRVTLAPFVGLGINYRLLPR